MKKILSKGALFVSLAIVFSCNNNSNNNNPTPTPTPAATTAAKTYRNLTFTPALAYFSTNGTMSAPIDSAQAKLATNTTKIDITYIYNNAYSEPGFFDPKARSQSWYWTYHYLPWLSTGVETRYYSTTLNKNDFDAAAADETKIGQYFSSASTILAPHAIFPTGSCIGGRQTSGPTSELLGTGKVFGFKNTTSGKRGLIWINTSQGTAWPWANNETKVDIIREN